VALLKAMRSEWPQVLMSGLDLLTLLRERLPALLESRLFGHVKGAFTGRWRNCGAGAPSGRHDLPDEIGDTSAALQAKLLRVHADQEFYPVGAERPERTEARMLAATTTNANKN
jgi:transcriptional regulator with GAF, ATPase, and Fis domain